METCLPRLKVMQVKMKMACVSGLAVVLLCCSAVASKDPSSDCNIYGVTGSEVTVPVKGQLQPQGRLTWKNNRDVIIRTKLEDITKFKDLTENGSYILTNLKKSSSGVYIYEIHDKDGKQTSTMENRVCVLDAISKPKMTVECVESKVGFTCIPAQEQVNVMWLEDDKPVTKQDVLTLQKEAAETKSKRYSCKVWNKASSYISEPLTHNCNTNNYIFPSIDDKFLGVSIWIFVGTGGGVVLVLMVVVIVCCVRSKKKRSMQLEEEEELRLGWTNNKQPNHHHHLPPLPDNHPNHHHPHHQHHHHEQQQQQARQSRSKQHRHQRPRAPEPSEGQPQPQPQPRRGAQASRPADNDEDHPPPLPQPRKKTPRGHVG